MTATPVQLKHILIVEDYPSVRELLSRQFKDAHFQVDSAEDYQSAIELLERQPPFDVALFDLTIPLTARGEGKVENGMKLMRETRRKFGSLPIVVTSSRFIGREIQAAFDEVRVAQVFEKPILTDEVCDYVVRLLEDR